MEAKIAVLPGDGVGEEIIKEGVKVLQKVAEKFGHRFTYSYARIGGIAIDETGTPLPAETLEMCRRSDAILLGAVGGPKWDNPSAPTRPEAGLLTLRKELDLYANLRPVKVYRALQSTSPLKEDLVAGVDLVIVRELTGGLYFGQPSKRWQDGSGWKVVDTLSYSDREIERILRAGFELARKRRKKVTSVDKQNVLSSSRLWREIAVEIGGQYPDVELEHVLVDACSMYLISRPKTFDVVVMENMFGDILSDESSVLAGSMGMLPSASLGQGKPSLFEPIHGSAPTLAGQNKVNPIATILSSAMLLRHSLDLETEATAIERAVENVLDEGYRTFDITQPGKKLVGTSQMGDAIAAAIS